MAIAEVCTTCKHFHGRYYSGDKGCSLLVCGFWPYGPEEGGSECPDYEYSPDVLHVPITPISLGMPTDPQVFRHFCGALDALVGAVVTPALVEGAQEALMNAVHALGRVPIPLDAEHQIRIINLDERLSASDAVPADPEEACIDSLTKRGLSPAVARVRVREFCDRHPHINPLELWRCIGRRQVRLQHGRLVPCKGFPRPKRTPRYNGGKHLHGE